MKNVTPKEFIDSLFIQELGVLVSTSPYLSFMIISIGIEFLGKCLETNQKDWHQRNESKKNFVKALNDLPSLNKYLNYHAKFNFYDGLRSGLLHAAIPTGKITLSSRDELGHLQQSTNESINLKIEDFYKDFKEACEHIISMSFGPDDKMSNAILVVPGIDFKSISGVSFGVTSSLANASGSVL